MRTAILATILVMSACAAPVPKDPAESYWTLYSPETKTDAFTGVTTVQLSGLVYSCVSMGEGGICIDLILVRGPKEPRIYVRPRYHNTETWLHIQNDQPLLVLADSKKLSLSIAGAPKQSIDSYAREWALYEISKNDLQAIACSQKALARLSGENHNATFELKRQVIDYWKRFYMEYLNESRPGCI